VIHTDKPSLSVCAFGAGAAHAAALALVLPVMITLPAPNDWAQGTVAIQVAVHIAPPAPFIAAAVMPDAGRPDGETGEGDLDEAGWNTPPPPELAGALQETATLSEPVAPEMAGAAPQEVTSAAPPEITDASPHEITGALPGQTERAALAEAIEQAALPEQVALAAPVEAAEPVVLPDPALVESLPAPVPEADAELETVASVESTEPAEPDDASATVPLPLRKPQVSTAAVEPAVPVESQRPAPTRPVTVRRTPSRASATSQKPVFKGLLGGSRATPMEEYRVPGG
jgi:hypothetical protein